MSRVPAGFAAVAAVALVGLTHAAPAAAHAPDDDMHELPSVMAMHGAGDHVRRGVTLYLDGDGARLTGGWDDSAADVSSIAMRVDGTLEVPAWRGGSRRWREVVACVRDRFAEFAVDVVTDRPAGGDYIMIVVGGEPSLVGYPDSVSGVAPYTGSVLHRAVGFVFSENVRHDVEATCVSILHEAGHAMGLDHAYLCEDPMSYLWGCGEKRFRDEDAYCGESEERACGSGEVTQNSWRHLAAYVGLRDAGGAGEVDDRHDDVEQDDADHDDGGPPWRGDDLDPYDDEPWADDAWDEDADDDAGDDVAPAPAQDAVAPSVAIDGGDEQLPGDRWIQVVVRASDDTGIDDVELGWASEEAQYVLPCARIPDELPVTCRRDGDTFVFRLRVGTGLRAMIARATDAAGNQTISEPRVIYLE